MITKSEVSQRERRSSKGRRNKRGYYFLLLLLACFSLLPNKKIFSWLQADRKLSFLDKLDKEEEEEFASTHHGAILLFFGWLELRRRVEVGDAREWKFMTVGFQKSSHPAAHLCETNQPPQTRRGETNNCIHHLDRYNLHTVHTLLSLCLYFVCLAALRKGHHLHGPLI
jgi:hypothetical protein